MASRYSALCRRYGFLMKDESLFDLAFTHPSCNADAGTKHTDYERLEFLGDAVTGMAVAELCYRFHPEKDEGGLTQIKNQLVRGESEARLCEEMGLPEYINLSGSFLSDKDDPDKIRKVHEDVFESFIGALYLDQGQDFALSFVRALFEARVKEAKIELDPKSALQQYLQSDGAVTIEYRVVWEEGTPQNKHVVSAVYFDGHELGRGQGHNKKQAETEAARDALTKLSIPQGE